MIVNIVRYQDAIKLDSYPIFGEIDTYYGGGYTVELFPRWKNSAILNDLKKRRWLDRFSRALITEFTIYNTATNLFTSVRMLVIFSIRFDLLWLNK